MRRIADTARCQRTAACFNSWVGPAQASELSSDRSRIAPFFVLSGAVLPVKSRIYATNAATRRDLSAAISEPKLPV